MLFFKCIKTSTLDRSITEELFYNWEGNGKHGKAKARVTISYLVQYKRTCMLHHHTKHVVWDFRENVHLRYSSIEPTIVLSPSTFSSIIWSLNLCTHHAWSGHMYYMKYCTCTKIPTRQLETKPCTTSMVVYNKKSKLPSTGNTYGRLQYIVAMDQVRGRDAMPAGDVGGSIEIKAGSMIHNTRQHGVPSL